MRCICNMDKAIDCLFPGLKEYLQENEQTKPADKSIFHFLYYISRMISIVILLYFLQNINALDVQENISQLAQSLSQNYINDIIVNQTSDLTKEYLQYNISATKTGCQCQEQIYPYNCSSHQKLYQNCYTINPNQQINISKFPFQKGQNVNYGLPIWIVRSSTSPMDKLQHKNYQNGLCKVNYTICSNQMLSICQSQSSNESCPLSSFEIDKNLQTKDQISNKIRNTTSFINDLIITNGSCSRQSQDIRQQDYILNQDSKYAKYPKNLKSIAQYQIKSVLFVNNQFENYYKNRTGLDETNGTFEICALTFNVTEECSNTMLDLFDKIKLFNDSMFYLVVSLLTAFILTFQLLAISCFRQKVNLIYGILITMEFLIMLAIIASLVFNILYNQNISNRCWLIEFEYIFEGYILIGVYFVNGLLIILFIKFYCKRQNQNYQSGIQTNSKQTSDLATPIDNKSSSVSIHRSNNSRAQLILIEG